MREDKERCSNMDTNIGINFSKISNIKVEEAFGNCFVVIEAGSYCIFNISIPSNGLHHHNCYELCFVTSGVGEFVHGAERFTLKKGDVFIALPNVTHEIRLKKFEDTSNNDSLCLVFFRIFISINSTNSTRELAKNKPKLYEEKLLCDFFDNCIIVKSEQNHLFSYLDFLNSYEGQSTNENYGLYQMVRNMALESLFSLINRKDNQYQKQIYIESFVDKAINYIGANLHRRIYLQEIAVAACTSERNLQNHFKRYLNVSVTDYINQRKIAVAAGYLKMNFKVNDICGIIGINDVGQFSRLFKKYTGFSPKKYQMQYSPEGMVSGAAFHCK